MAATETLALWGVLRAPEVVELAAAVGLELAAAAVLLEKESGGGRNVWGSDAVQTGGFYAKGAAVTRENYTAWKPNRSRLGSQGVGPCQLTWSGYQDQADQLGGCWDWRHNVRVGFAALVQLQRQYGVRDGFRRYNGSGPMAERYADDAMTKLGRWRTRLGPAAASPVPQEEDMPLNAQDLALIADIIRREVGEAVWRWGIPDYTKEAGPDGKLPAMRADVGLGWGIANAGRSNEAASDAADGVDELKARPAAGPDPDKRYRLVAE